MASTAADQVSYTDLYARWERGNWSATGLDFSEDKRHWEESFTAFERKAARGRAPAKAHFRGDRVEANLGESAAVIITGAEEENGFVNAFSHLGIS